MNNIIKTVKKNLIQFFPEIIIFGLITFVGIMTLSDIPKFGTVHDMEYFIYLMYGGGFASVGIMGIFVMLFEKDK